MPLDPNNPQAQEIESLRPKGFSVLIPPIPFTPLPNDIVERLPSMERWHAQWNADMQKWAQQLTFVLETTAKAIEK